MSISAYDQKDLRDDGIRVRLHRNESALPAPEHVLEAVRNITADDLRWYPTELQRRFTRNLARRLVTRAENVALACGADEVLAALGRAFLKPGENAVTVTPTFGMYARIIEMTSASCRGVPYARKWKLDCDALLAAADSRTKLVIVGHPNNPTGDAADAQAVLYLSQMLPNAVVAVDEVYLALSSLSLLRCIEAAPNVVVLASLSKIAALAGMRVGYAVAPSGLAETLRRVIPPYPLAAASLLAADAYVCGGAATAAFERRLRAQVERSLDAVVSEIGPLAAATWRGPANFVLMEFGSEAARIVSGLAARGIAVRPVDSPYLDGGVRFCASDDRSTDELIETVRSILAKDVARA